MEEEKLDNIDIREIARKSTTKAEVYKVLTTTGGVYLPPVDQINSDFIRDILAGDKLYIECNRVRIIEVPHIEGLRIPEVLEFASIHCSIQKYMPDYESEKYPSRKWICNVVNSLIHDQFKRFLNEKIVENNDKIDRKEGNRFSVLPSIVKTFNETKFVSKRRGRFHQLIKNSKKRRAEKERIASKNKKDQEMIDYMNNQEDEIERMREELEDYKQRLDEHLKDTDLLKHLFEIGHIDIDGNPINKDELIQDSIKF